MTDNIDRHTAYEAMRSVASTSLTWAFAASVAAHSFFFLALPLRDRNVATGAAGGQRLALEARLVDRADTIQPAAQTPSVEPLLVATVQAPMPAPIATAAVAPSVAATVDTAAGGAEQVEIESRPLSDRSVLGGLITREQSEFPIEIDVPPQIEGKIAVTFPAATLASDRAGAVAVWVVVDESGSPDEIQVAEGGEQFADAIVAAIKTARFRPARNNFVPIRFPISLEFRFPSAASASVAEARTAPRR